MTDVLLTQASRYLELKGIRKELEDQLDAVKEEAKAISVDMVTAMEESDVDTFAVKGTLFYIKVSVHVSAPAEHRETLIRRLRARKLGHLIRPTIQANTLQSFVKEQMAENDGAVPEWIADLVTVYSAPEIATRKK